MTIKTRLRISSLIYVVITLVTGLVMLISLQNLSQGIQTSRTSYAIVKDLMGLTTLIQDYLVHPEKRSIRQWQIVHSAIGKLLQKHSVMETAEPEISARLIQGHEEIKSILSQVISVQEKTRSDESTSRNLIELRDRLTGMLLMQLQAMVSDSSRLYTLAQARIDDLLNRLAWTIVFFFGVTGLIIIGNHILTRNTLLTPLARLTKDAEILGNGNLGHVVAITSNDEMGQLGQAFNSMAMDLKKSYDSLEAEIVVRGIAQLELQKNKDSLEELVAQRTVELSKKNDDLLKEIEERLKLQTDLQIEKNFSEITLDSLPGIFYTFDGNGKFIRWNKNFEKLSGCSATEVSASHPMDFFVPVDKPIVAEAIERVYREGVGTVEADFLSKDGSRTPIFFTGLLADLYGTQCLIGVGIDITELKRAQAELSRHARALERANTELERFAYISSHHMQEPLRKVINFAQLMERRYKGRLDERADRYLDYLIDGAGRMRALIEDLLIYTRLDRSPPNCETVNLNESLRKVVAGLDAGIRSANGVVTLDDLPSLFADPREMRMLFENLISNAVKFRGEQPLHLHVSARKDNGDWILSVGDNGIGIDPLYSEKIFGIFEKLHSVGKYQGTGIGLALCKKIVERHGGRIWFESQPGEGSVFYFTLGEKHGH